MRWEQNLGKCINNKNFSHKELFVVEN